jgi:hypothetical protein
MRLVVGIETHEGSVATKEVEDEPTGRLVVAVGHDEDHRRALRAGLLTANARISVILLR